MGALVRPAIAAIIPAAGSGRRLRSKFPKPLVPIGSIPLFVRTVRAITRAYRFSRVVVPVTPRLASRMRACAARYRLGTVEFVEGGRTRADSVRRGLARLGAERLVLIHDVARPFVRREDVRRVIDAARRSGAAILAAKATATVKEIRPRSRFIRRTIDRERIRLAQTPQVFDTRLLRRAYGALGDRVRRFTDEAGMIEALGGRVAIVEGSGMNIKITTPEDLEIAGAIQGRFYLRKGR